LPSNSIFHWAFSNVLQWTNLRALFVGSMADRQRDEVRALFAAVLKRYRASPYCDEDAALDFVDGVVDEAFRRAERTPPGTLRTACCELVWQLLFREPVVYGMPEQPDFAHLSHEALQH
jgi:hypothetical protein